jgi:beta-aspartyl-peptidase (threonine type)
MGTQRPAIVVHGGAGEWRPERRQRGVIGVKKAAEHGFAILRTGGAALDAVESAVKSMEDDETFNAGLGSSLALSKCVEMEASIMDGKALSAGAVGLLRDVKYPVHLARLVMEHTDHVFVVGRGALRLAEIFNMERRNSKTELREKYWVELTQKMERGELGYLPKLHKLLQSHPHLFDTDTVGAVAVDKGGNVAAATSTGGISLKIPGRIGDSPLIGCGNYADNEAGACSATGIGEIAIKLVLAKSTCDVMRGGQSPQNAVEVLIGEVNRRMREGVNHMGLIAIDARGRIGAAHNSSHMCWAYVQPRASSSRAFAKAKVGKKAV